MTEKISSFIGIIIGAAFVAAIALFITLFLRIILMFMPFILGLAVALYILALPLHIWFYHKSSPEERAWYIENNKRFFREGFVLIPAFVGAFAPPYAVLWLINRLVYNIPMSLIETSDRITPFLDKTVGLFGLLFAVVGAYYGSSIMKRQARQVENLATSKARSAALGLSEFTGVARAVDDPDLLAEEKPPAHPSQYGYDGIPYDVLVLSVRREDKKTITTSNAEYVRRFFLEDRTGRILVDPRGAGFADDLVSWYRESARKILLRKRTWEDDQAIYEARWISPGSRVYLIGTVEENPEASEASDSGRLIVRPSSRPFSFGALWRFVLGTVKDEPGSEFRDIFILSDRPETLVQSSLLKSANMAWALSLLWIAPSIMLLIFG